MSTPVLLVHGIWESGGRFDRMVQELAHAEIGPTRALSLRPSDGSAPIEDLAGQIAHGAKALLDETGARRLDLVGFSMGALASRYFIQRGGGRELIRRFISIAGPHAGTLMAYVMRKPGVRQMRPKSPLLEDLAQDDDPFGEVEVHTLWTPFDAMIVPPRSSRLSAAASDHRLPIALHRWMITHPRAVERVKAILSAPLRS